MTCYTVNRDWINGCCRNMIIKAYYRRYGRRWQAIVSHFAFSQSISFFSIFNRTHLTGAQSVVYYFYSNHFCQHISRFRINWHIWKSSLKFS